MKNVVSNYADKFRTERKAQFRLALVMIVLAVLIGMIVYWQMRDTGIAMANETYCGYEEHQHDESCYTQVLTCGLEESASVAGHTHDSSCYETVQTLVCEIPESEGHSHSEGCYDEEGNIICGLEESGGHTHDESCYTTEQVLVCGLEETEAVIGHTHDSSCYTTALTCEIPEHVHSDLCLRNENADLETAKVWESTLPGLSGDWARDVVAVAKSQLGYTESEANFQLASDGVTRQGYTRYGAWYGNEYGDWDAMFASFCLYYAGVRDNGTPYFPYNSGAYAWTVELRQSGLYQASGDHIPAAGDLVFLDTDYDGQADTVAIVSEVVLNRGGDVTSIKVIQGNYNDTVAEYAVGINDPAIQGYGALPAQPGTEAAELAAETAGDTVIDISGGAASTVMIGSAVSGENGGETGADGSEDASEEITGEDDETSAEISWETGEAEEAAAEDEETAADWEATLPELTGNWAHDVVAVAQSQLGYTESEDDFEVAEDGVTRRGYTRYGAWYGGAYEDWDAMFASFCLYYGGVPESMFPESRDACAWAEELEGDGLLAGPDHAPANGDIVFLDTDGNDVTDTVAIVASLENGVLTLIQGDHNDAVEQYTLSAEDGSVMGYGVLPEQENAPAAEDDELGSGEMAGGSDEPDDGIMTLSGDTGGKLDGDYAYLGGVGMQTGSNDGVAMATGTAPWDNDDEAGNDSSASNRILRTFDTATYTVTMTTHVREGAPYQTYETGDLYFELVVKGAADEVQWEIGSMGWLESKHGVYTVREETYNGEVYQVLRGYIELELVMEEGHDIGESTQALNLVLRALAMQNGDTLVPQFTFFLAFNDVGLTEEEYAAWGTEDYNGPILTFEGGKCEEHGQQEYSTIYGPEVTISAAPRYNLAIVNSTASKTQQMGSYDFSTGNDLALDKLTSGDTEYYGRLGSYGLVLQIVGKSANDGLRGVEIPEDGEELTISFTLDLSSTYTAGTNRYETGTTSNGRDLTAYAPRIWSFDENKTGSSQQDARTIPVTTRYADQVPYNKLSNNTSYDYASCYNGGTWRIKDNGDGTYTVTVADCVIDMQQLPYVYPGAGTSLSYKYYNPNDINYDIDDDTKNDYWEVQTACISAGELWVVQPYYAGAKNDETYIAGVLGEGTFSVTLKDTDLEVRAGDETLQSAESEQAVTTDDSQGQSMSLVNPGSIDMHVAYIKYNYSAYNDPLTDGCFTSARDWILQGNRLGIEDYLTNDSAEEGNTGVAYDVLIKWDDAFFEPDGTIKHNGYLNSETRTDLWAAKADGSGWDHKGLSPDEDGYDTEMINATPDDLVYFSSLEDLEKAGYTCVGVLVQYRGLMTEQQNHLHTYVLGTSKGDAETDQVYMITHYGRAWSRSDLAKAMAADSGSGYDSEDAALSALLSMSLNEVNTLVKQYIPTRTASNSLTYEDGDGNYVDYPESWWINGDPRHPTTSEGGSSRTETILNYVKCSYDENGCHEGTSNNYWGDSCLLVGYNSGLTMKVAEKTTAGDGSTHEKTVFDMDAGQTVVDYEMSPFINRNNGEINFDVGTTTEVVITVTLPENLTYIEGSSYIGGTYEAAGEGKQGTVTGGVQLITGVETTFTYTVDDVEYTIGVILTTSTNSKGEQVLTYTFTDVPVTGEETVQYLEQIFFSCEISSGAVKNGDELDVTADISCSSDSGVDPSLRENGEATVGITISKDNALSLVKRADSVVVEVNEEIGFTIDIGDNSGNPLTMVMVDNLPYNGDGRSSFANEDCEVHVTKFSVYDKTKKRDLSGYYFFYTTSKEFAETTSIDYPDGEYFVTNLGSEDESAKEEVNEKCVEAGWTQMKMTSEERDGYIYYTFEDFPEDDQVYAIVAIGIVEGEEDINLHVNVTLTDAEPGDEVVNRATQQHSYVISGSDDREEIEPYAEVKQYEDLADSARTRVVGRAISGTVWLDEDMDGTIQEGIYKAEQLLSGVTVELQTQDSSGNWVTAQSLKGDSEGSTECKATTDGSGYYEFDYLPEGEYRIVFSGTGTGDISGGSYVLSEHDVTIGDVSLVERTDEGDEAVDEIAGITLPSKTAISGDIYELEDQDAGYTKTTFLTVEKLWQSSDGSDINAPEGASVSVRVTTKPTDNEEEDLVQEVTLSDENGWTDTMKDLLYYDGAGKPLDYTVSARISVKEVEGYEGYAPFVKIAKDNDGNGYAVTVTNREGTGLPKTGGRGIWIYAVVGLSLVTGSGAAIILRSRRKKEI